MLRTNNKHYEKPTLEIFTWESMDDVITDSNGGMDIDDGGEGGSTPFL